MARKSKKAPQKLTAPQRKFCEHYALTGNGAESYGVAYPTSRKHDSQYRAKKADELLRGKNAGEIGVEVERLKTKVAKVLDEKFEITAEKVLQEIAAIALQNSDDYFEWGYRDIPILHKKGELAGQQALNVHGDPVTRLVPFAAIKDSSKLTRRQKAAVISATESTNKFGDTILEVKMADKLGALKLLGTHLKLFNQQIEHTGANGGPIAHTSANAVVTTDITQATSPVEALKMFDAFRQGLANVKHAAG